MTFGLFWYKNTEKLLLNTSHEDIIIINYTKQLLIFRYSAKVFVLGF